MHSHTRERAHAHMHPRNHTHTHCGLAKRMLASLMLSPPAVRCHAQAALCASQGLLCV